MSQSTIQVDQFLLNSLQPEIDRLNISLLNMEKYGYNSPVMQTTKKKLEKLLPIYDFLYEYAHGNEECDIAKINRLMSFTGTSLLSKKTSAKMIPTTRRELSTNYDYTADFIRIYADGEIMDKNLLVVREDLYDFDIFLPKMYSYTIVELNIDGSIISEGSPTNHVRIPDIEINSNVIGASFTIKGFITMPADHANPGTPDFEKTITMEIVKSNCQPAVVSTYYVGGTKERFTIGLTDINETTNISITPNDGTNQGGTILDLDWIIANLEDEDVLEGSENIEVSVTSAREDAHLILAYPTQYMRIIQVNEVVLNTKATMSQGLHYDITDVPNTSGAWEYIYLRDLADFTYNAQRIIEITLEIL